MILTNWINSQGGKKRRLQEKREKKKREKKKKEKDYRISFLVRRVTQM